MDTDDIRRNGRFLWALTGVAPVYIGLMLLLPALTGNDTIDGSIGVLLGLYICSHPAANAIKLLFYQPQLLHQLKREPPGIRWLALNILVLFVGWLVITIGVHRLIGTA
jgi:hypothetical protein